MTTVAKKVYHAILLPGYVLFIAQATVNPEKRQWVADKLDDLD